MEFLQSIILAVASFFGLNAEPVQLDSVVDQVMEVAPQEFADGMEAVETAVSDPGAVIGELEATEVLQDITDSNVTEGAADSAMSGAAKPVSNPAATSQSADIRTALVAGGCFWCVESDLEKTPGVIAAVSGYAGGTTENPTYKDYGSGGHREVVEVTFDANQISFEEILIVTMKTTDPTDDDGTFADRGDKYSAAFYYESDAERQIIEDLIAEVDELGPYDAPLAIDVEKRATFWEAEDFHQDYYKGTLSKLKYGYYRTASGRDRFIDTYWEDKSSKLPWRAATTNTNETTSMNFWENYTKPSKDELKAILDAVTFKVTQEDGTERAGTSPLDKNWEDGIYVDVLSGEPLYSSRDKFDSGTGWPSFVQPIRAGAITEHEDRKLFSVRTETRSAIADNHIGHVFTDGPADRGGLRYCMNGVALKFIPKADMEAKGYGDYLADV